MQVGNPVLLRFEGSHENGDFGEIKEKTFRAKQEIK